MTPATILPSWPANSPKVSSSSASRSRCKITWPAVVAAILPKPAGVSSYSRTRMPFSSVSAAQTVTCPVCLFTSTLAVGAAPSDLWYATSNASSMALITRSIEMSFSASRLRRTVTSMSIWSLLVRQAAELHLHPAWSELAVINSPLRAVDFQRDALLIRVDHSCFMVNGTHGRIPLWFRIPAREWHDDQPADRAPPVPGLGQRPVDPRRGHLERVRRVAHRVLRIKPRRDLTADLRDVVQADSAIGIHDDPQHPAPPGGRDLNGLQVHLHGMQHGLDHAGNSRDLCGAWQAAPVAWTRPP